MASQMGSQDQYHILGKIDLRLAGDVDIIRGESIDHGDILQQSVSRYGILTRFVVIP
jgi:hypothetical protein